MRLLIVVMSILLVLVSSPVHAYEAVTVENGGTLSGTVKVEGDVLEDPTIEVTKNKDYCGETLPRQKYVVGPDRGVRYVAVIIKGISRGKPYSKDTYEIDNNNCAFVPHVQVGGLDQKLILKNSDPILHNTHLYFNNRTVFNIALPPIPGLKITKELSKTGLYNVRCDVHDWMQGYLFVNDHPYHAVTDEKGRFSITEVPAGTYKVKVWHEAFGEQEHEVTISAGKTATLNITY